MRYNANMKQNPEPGLLGSPQNTPDLADLLAYAHSNMVSGKTPVPKAKRLENGAYVVRDDLLVGGTKTRVLLPLLQASSEKIFAYASPAYGYAQIALAVAATLCGKRAHIFVAQRTELHYRTQQAKDLGAMIHQVPHGYLSVTQARAREFCEQPGAMLIPFGAGFPGAIELIADAARSTGLNPTWVWCVAASGTLSRGLQQAWPNARHHVVRVGADPHLTSSGRHLLAMYEAPEKFDQDARDPPPFPSCLNYDAKIWGFFKHQFGPGHLYWNVAGIDTINA